ncbi:hypothetical protein RF11_08124 [Thelohanellus kitauei]|uniref:Uncharacterized protein n=1 Tax=Thelohanellus kitauei TaxID=669202 RepID=A0A0C2IEM4_THEKT|nr:hypothetical protein RF11_08124 [Thelohanellus kitauei]
MNPTYKNVPSFGIVVASTRYLSTPFTALGTQRMKKPKESPQIAFTSSYCYVNIIFGVSGTQAPTEESGMMSKYPEGKLAFKIRSGAFGLVWLARASELFTLAALSRAIPKSLHQGTGHPLDSEKRV